MELKKNMYWAYLHKNGSIILKRWFGDHKDFQDDCDNNPFVLLVVHPYEASSYEEALDIANKKLLIHSNQIHKDKNNEKR